MRMKGKKNSLQEFKRFCLARPGQQEIIKNLIKQGKYAKAEIMKSYEVTEFIHMQRGQGKSLVRIGMKKLFSGMLI